MQLDAEGTGSIHTLMDRVCSPPANYSVSKSLYLKVSVTAELQTWPQKVLLIHMDSPSLWNFQQWGSFIPFLRMKSGNKLLDKIISWLIFYFFNHRVGTSWNKENSINFCVPLVPCLGFLLDCEIPKFKTVFWFNCTQYLVEHEVHIGSGAFHSSHPKDGNSMKEIFFSVPCLPRRTGSSGATSRDIQSLDGVSRGNLDKDVGTRGSSSSSNTLDYKECL